jgi:ATP-dependent helicase/nuclease subunit B
MRSGNFRLIGSEVEFGRGKELPELVIDLNGEDKIYLFGKIDRVDETTVDGKKYIRIIDYKSSNKAIKLSHVYYGIQLQLLTYSDVFTSDGLEFGGAFYLKLDDPVLKSNKRISKEEIENEIKKSLRMNGIVISNVKLIEAMDNEFNSDKLGTSFESNILNLKISKEGNYSKMPVISSKDFGHLKNRIHDVIRSIAKEILKGNINNEPLNIKGRQMACSYCDYREICKFDKCLGNKDRHFDELNDEEVLKNINE